MLFVYWFEDDPRHAERVNQVFARMVQRGDALCTSVFTLGEVLTGPYKKKEIESVQRLRAFFQPPHVELLPFTVETADNFARIRGQHKISPADAIHLATAASAGVDLFLSNDRRLQKLVIPGIDFIAGMDVNLF